MLIFRIYPNVYIFEKKLLWSVKISFAYVPGKNIFEHSAFIRLGYAMLRNNTYYIVFMLVVK